MRFEYYVMNYDSNLKKVVPFNIFQNILLNEETEKEARRYLRYPSRYKYTDYKVSGKNKSYYGFEGFSKCLQSLIMWQEWSRCEYEIAVGSIFESDADKYQKIDCYEQAKNNIDVIAREVLYQARQQKKEE